MGEGRKNKIFFLQKKKNSENVGILFSLMELSEFLETDPNAPLHNMCFLRLSNTFYKDILS